VRRAAPERRASWEHRRAGRAARDLDAQGRARRGSRARTREQAVRGNRRGRRASTASWNPRTRGRAGPRRRGIRLGRGNSSWSERRKKLAGKGPRHGSHGRAERELEEERSAKGEQQEGGRAPWKWAGRARQAGRRGQKNRARDAGGTEQEAPTRRTLGELGRGRELGHDAVELRLGVSASEGEDAQELQSREGAALELRPGSRAGSKDARARHQGAVEDARRWSSERRGRGTHAQQPEGWKPQRWGFSWRAEGRWGGARREVGAVGRSCSAERGRELWRAGGGREESGRWRETTQGERRRRCSQEIKSKPRKNLRTAVEEIRERGYFPIFLISSSLFFLTTNHRYFRDSDF
jgi:hypothetical protein